MARKRIQQVEYRWHLRALMAQAGMFATTDLAPLLAERGVVLSAAQIYRLVTGTPERLNLHTMAALCDILACTPTDLVETFVEEKSVRLTATATPPKSASAKGRTPRRAEIRRDQ